MATRRPQRVRCDIVANVLFAFALSVTGLIAGCEGRDDVAGGIVDSGAPGSAGGSGSGGAGGGSGSGGSVSGTISCNPTAGGCLCIADDAQPGQLTSCSPTSVPESEAERGVCCLTLSLCTCLRYSCRSDPASSFCQCGSVAALAGVTLGSPAAECPAPTPPQKCCFSQDNATCICSRAACAAEETEVANCSATAAGACPAGEEITTCR